MRSPPPYITIAMARYFGERSAERSAEICSGASTRASVRGCLGHEMNDTSAGRPSVFAKRNVIEARCCLIRDALMPLA